MSSALTTVLRCLSRWSAKKKTTAGGGGRGASTVRKTGSAAFLIMGILEKHELGVLLRPVHLQRITSGKKRRSGP